MENKNVVYLPTQSPELHMWSHLEGTVDKKYPQILLALENVYKVDQQTFLIQWLACWLTARKED